MSGKIRTTQDQRYAARWQKPVRVELEDGGRISVQGIRVIGGALVSLWQSMPNLPPEVREPDVVLELLPDEARSLAYTLLQAAAGASKVTRVEAQHSPPARVVEAQHSSPDRYKPASPLPNRDRKRSRQPVLPEADPSLALRSLDDRAWPWVALTGWTEAGEFRRLRELRERLLAGMSGAPAELRHHVGADGLSRSATAAQRLRQFLLRMRMRGRVEKTRGRGPNTHYAPTALAWCELVMPGAPTGAAVQEAVAGGIPRVP